MGSSLWSSPPPGATMTPEEENGIREVAGGDYWVGPLRYLTILLTEIDALRATIAGLENEIHLISSGDLPPRKASE